MDIVENGHRPLPWNNFLPRPNPLSVSLFKMAAYRIIYRSARPGYSSLAQQNTPALQATFAVTVVKWVF